MPERELTPEQIERCAADPFYAALHQDKLELLANRVRQDISDINLSKALAAARMAPEPQGRSTQLSPMLVKLNAAMGGMAEKDLCAVVPYKWQVLISRYSSEQLPVTAEGDKRVAGYLPAVPLIAVSQCTPDLLTYLRSNGITGRVRLAFEANDGSDRLAPIDLFVAEHEVSEPRQLDPNAGLPQILMAMMQQQREDRQIMLGIVAKLGDKTHSADKDWQEKFDRMQAEHRNEMRQLVEKSQQALDSDKKRQLGGNFEQLAYQAMNATAERMFTAVLNPQQAAQQAPAAPGMGMAPQSGIQGLAQFVQTMRADEEAKEVLRRELPSLLGAAKPEPTLFEQIQQLLPVFMLLKNMNGKSGPQLENAMQAMMQQRGAGTSPDVNTLTGLPIPDAAPADGEAALQQLANLSAG